MNTLHDWLKQTRATFPSVTRSHRFSRALRQLHGLTSSFNWFIVSSVSLVIGYRDHIGFGFTSLNRPFYSCVLGDLAFEWQ